MTIHMACLSLVQIPVFIGRLQKWGTTAEFLESRYTRRGDPALTGPCSSFREDKQEFKQHCEILQIEYACLVTLEFFCFQYIHTPYIYLGSY